MAISYDEEITIREDLATTIGNVSEAGYVIPSPIFFINEADFWNSINVLTDKTDIETTLITFTCLSFLGFRDTMASNMEHPVQTDLIYNVYHFRQYDYERADETATPDVFLKTTLNSYKNFVKALFGLRTEFIGRNPITVTGYEVNSNELTMLDFARENDVCRYIPTITGHAVDMQLRVTVIEPC